MKRFGEDMLKVWGRKNSINAQKVLRCCDELGASRERVDTSLRVSRALSGIIRPGSR